MVNDFRNNVMYAASRAEMKDLIRRGDKGYYFLPGFEIKVLKNTVCIYGHVFLKNEYVLRLLYETGSAKNANFALDRCMQISKEIARIKTFAGLESDDIKVGMSFNMHTKDTTTNYMVGMNTEIWGMDEQAKLSAYYLVQGVNTERTWLIHIHTENYTARRFERNYLPEANEFTRVYKYAKNEFKPDTQIHELRNSLHVVGLPYRLMALAVSVTTGVSAIDMELMTEYGVPIPADKEDRIYYAVKVASVPNVYALGC